MRLIKDKKFNNKLNDSGKQLALPSVADTQAQKTTVDLEAAEAHEIRITKALNDIKDQVYALVREAPKDRSQWNEEQKNDLVRLSRCLVKISEHQEKLKQDMIYARKERRQLQTDRLMQAGMIPKPKLAAPVRMEELRSLKVNTLSKEEMLDRYKKAQKPKGILPSGGFTNFRVAPDLTKMDFKDEEAVHDYEIWRNDKPKKLK